MNLKESLALKRVREILLPLVIIGVVPFLASKFLLPKIRQIDKFQRQLKKNEAEVLNLENKVSFLEQQRENDVFSDFEKVIQVLPNEKDVPGLLIAVDNLRKNSDLTLGAFGLKPGLIATAGAGLDLQAREELQFSLPVASSYDNLLIFLERIENIAPITSVEKIDIDFSSGKEEVRANLLLNTHYFPLGEEVLIVDSPLPEFSPPVKEILGQVLGFEVFIYESSLPEEEIGKENPFSPTDNVILSVSEGSPSGIKKEEDSETSSE